MRLAALLLPSVWLGRKNCNYGPKMLYRVGKLYCRRPASMRMTRFDSADLADIATEHRVAQIKLLDGNGERRGHVTPWVRCGRETKR